jgi:selenocysteine-specific elongation factor
MNMTSTQLNPNRQYIIGTAGHIDHGKTALVSALSGIDTDNLPEEKERGITVNIGFAHLSDNITIIDVPGHERLIKNMVAGVSTIDLVLFAIAADDGIMPQTREHLDIVKLLGIQHGIFVITKSDLVDKDWIKLVKDEIANLLHEAAFRNAPILTTSIYTADGIENLREMLVSELAKIPPKHDLGILREPVDRVFNIKGFGTVITGTVLSGSLKAGDPVEIQPAGIRTRARSLQTHDAEVKEVGVGYRAAVNLAGVESNQIERGDVLVQPGLYQPVGIIDGKLSLLQSSPKSLKTNQRVRFHIHTAEAFARIIIPDRNELKPGDSNFVQIRLEQPVHAAYQDLFIIRQYSPQITIGGGVVLKTNPPRFRKKNLDIFQQTSNALDSDDPKEKILAIFDLESVEPVSIMDIKISTNIPLNELKNKVGELIKSKDIFSKKIGHADFYYSHQQLDMVLNKLTSQMEKYHKIYPNRPGMSDKELSSKLAKLFSDESFQLALELGSDKKKIIIENNVIRLADFNPSFSTKEAKLSEEIKQYYLNAKFTPPTLKEVKEKFNISEKDLKEIMSLLCSQGEFIFVDKTLVFHITALDEIKERIKVFFDKKSEMSVGEFKELTGTTRKHAIPLLAYFDGGEVTERTENVRRAGHLLQKR